RARAGAASSPLWRGGGRTFPNTPDENFTHKVNKKMYRAGLRSILSQLAREDRIAVVESFSLDAPKTRLAAQKLKDMGLDSVLIITDTLDETDYQGTRNLGHDSVVNLRYADRLSLIHYNKVMLVLPAIAHLEEVLG